MHQFIQPITIFKFRDNKSLTHFMILRHKDNVIILCIMFVSGTPFLTLREFIEEFAAKTNKEIKIKYPHTISQLSCDGIFHRLVIYGWHLQSRLRVVDL